MLDFIKKLDIILIGPIPPPAGGDATWSLGYIEYFKSKEINIDIINTSLIGKRSINADIKKNIFVEIYRSIKIWRNLIKRIKKHKPDLVHFNITCSKTGVIRDVITSKILKRKKIKYVLHCHCNIIDQLGTNKISKLCLKQIIKYSEKNIVLNKSSLAFSEKLVQGKALIIPNFIDKIDMSYKKNINKEIKSIIFVGHVKKAKGIDELLYCAKKHKDIIFNIVGPISNDYDRNTINLYYPNVILHGTKSRNEVFSMLVESDVFLFPSYTEGFSIALVEAMSVGLPCIATNVGANVDMIENYGGVIVDKMNPEDLSNAIDFMSDFNVRKKASVWNFKKVMNNYLLSNVMEKIIKLYENIFI